MRAASFLLSVAAAIASVKGAIVPQRRADVCNGHAELCNRSYGNVTFLGAHDSFAFSDDPLALAADQQVDIPTQLGLGVRLLQAQAHVNDGVLHFCHTSCLLFDGGTVEDYLNKVHDFLTANPNEVLTLLFTNPEGASLPDLWDPPFQASGIADLAYVPPSIPVKQSDWPTLGDLIDSGKRVIVFLDAGADTDRSVPYILPEFEMVWETPFSVTDATFPCSVDRINGPLSTEDHMYMINHSLNKNILDTGIIVSDPKDAPTTNSVSSILANAGGCEGFAAGRAPNFVLLDFVNLGQGLDAVNQLNGLA
ncbi:PLC-like phosphodiesterase [Dichomitus squalens]|uniref:PLC-like phosphodiesterase n=1 Tax=Dichomitus squalens TaxID=114155 RepID=A0A4Q9PB90_9APHY|nr:PLC-like phosphodiesterase [Dichomitus squalens]TBU48985.1 PLC-like phosphodiesterase [Dichomitus squalens]TBU51969.1 PLC-like phosphodiesterase [Dichomitus squalens]